MNRERALEIHVPPDPANLALVRLFFDGVGKACGFSQDEAMKVVMAVDEACANSIKGRDIQKAEIRIQVKIEDSRLTIVITDTNSNFKASFDRPVDFESHIREFRTHGLGLQMIKSFMDEVQYSHQPGRGNELRMVKYMGEANAN